MNGLYLLATINKILLHNGISPITDPITKMGVEHTVGPGSAVYIPKWPNEFTKATFATQNFVYVLLTNIYSTWHL